MGGYRPRTLEEDLEETGAPAMMWLSVAGLLLLALVAGIAAAVANWIRRLFKR